MQCIKDVELDRIGIKVPLVTLLTTAAVIN